MSKPPPADGGASKKRPASLADFFAPKATSATGATGAHASPRKAAASSASASAPTAKRPKLDAPLPVSAPAHARHEPQEDDPFAFDLEDTSPPAAARSAPPSFGGSAAAAAGGSSTPQRPPKKRRDQPVHMQLDNDEDEIDLTRDSPIKQPRPAAPVAASPARPRMVFGAKDPQASPRKDVAAAAATPQASPKKALIAAVAAAPAADAAALAAASKKAAAAKEKEARERRDREERAREAERMREREREREREERKAAAPVAPAAASSERPRAAAAAAASSSRAAAPKKAASRKKKVDEAQRMATDLALKISPDVDHVLAKVMALRKTIESEHARYDRGEKRLTLADLNLPNVKTDVLILNVDEVRATIERVMVHVVQSIVGGAGFQYEVPVRSSGNQLYVPELDRIVLGDKLAERTFASLKHGRKTALTTRIMGLVYELCLKRIHVTKRDLFYTDVKLFQKQGDSDDVIEDVACMLGCTRSSLNVVASDKGIVVGCISFKDDGDLIDCMRMGVGGKAIPPGVDRVTEIKGTAKFVLLVEKDAAFMRLAEDRFYLKYPCVIITAKGQPDVATRLFLKKVKETLRIPVLALVDADPYGLKILSVYMSGSKNMSYDSASLTTPDIKWLGVRPSDLDRYKIPQSVRLEMTEHDIKTGKELLEEEFIQKNPDWMEELRIMLDSKEKAEIQSLSSFGFQYLSNVYLPLKLQEGGWI